MNQTQGLGTRFLDPKFKTFSNLDFFVVALKKTSRLLPFFPDLTSIFQTFSRSGKLHCKFQFKAFSRIQDSVQTCKSDRKGTTYHLHSLHSIFFYFYISMVLKLPTSLAATLHFSLDMSSGSP